MNGAEPEQNPRTAPKGTVGGMRGGSLVARQGRGGTGTLVQCRDPAAENRLPPEAASDIASSFRDGRSGRDPDFSADGIPPGQVAHYANAYSKQDAVSLKRVGPKGPEWGRV